MLLVSDFYSLEIFQGWAPRSFPFRTFRSKKRMLRSFLEFLATYETQKNVTFFSVLFKRTEKYGKNVTFFLKERKRTQRTFRSF